MSTHGLIQISKNYGHMPQETHLQASSSNVSHLSEKHSCSNHRWIPCMGFFSFTWYLNEKILCFLLQPTVHISSISSLPSTLASYFILFPILSLFIVCVCECECRYKGVHDTEVEERPTRGEKTSAGEGRGSKTG